MPELAFIKNDEELFRILLAGQDVTIGRSENNDVIIDNVKVSRNHARVSRSDEGYTFNDLGSSNGSFFNEERIKEQVRAGLPIRALVLKGRQEGITTDTAGIIFHDTASNCNRKSVVVSHEPDSTKSIFEIYKTFYDQLPEEVRPMKRYDNKNTLTFANPSNDEEERKRNPGLNSSISVFTAKKKGGERTIKVIREGWFHSVPVPESHILKVG